MQFSYQEIVTGGNQKLLINQSLVHQMLCFYLKLLFKIQASLADNIGCYSPYRNHIKTQKKCLRKMLEVGYNAAFKYFRYDWQQIYWSVNVFRCACIFLENWTNRCQLQVIQELCTFQKIVKIFCYICCKDKQTNHQKYIDESSEGLSLNANLFADDTSQFSVIHDSNTSAIELNNDLAKINRWSFQWKRVLTQIQKKQAQEVDNSRLKKRVFAKIMIGFKQWNIGVVSGNK